MPKSTKIEKRCIFTHHKQETIDRLYSLNGQRNVKSHQIIWSLNWIRIEGGGFPAPTCTHQTSADRLARNMRVWPSLSVIDGRRIMRVGDWLAARGARGAGRRWRAWRARLAGRDGTDLPDFKVGIVLFGWSLVVGADFISCSPPKWVTA